MAPVNGFTDTGIMVVATALDTPPRHGMWFASRSKNVGNEDIMGIVELPYSIFSFPFAESISIGSSVVPSTDEIPHHIGT